MSPGLQAHLVLARGAFTLDVALDAAPGEVVGVIGPNGAGKSTALRALAGLLPLSGGKIELAGATLDDGGSVFVPPERRGVGVVFQDYRLFPHLSVRDNVAFGPWSAGLARRAARRAAQPWLDRLDLAELADRRPGRLSGGQAQRVALARALAASPGLLLLDEPLAALDARTRLEVRAGLRGHLAGFAGPTLVVTHDPLEAMILADRLVVVERGRVVQEGTPAGVARRPATEYVARLMGLNLYRGRLRAPQGGGVPGPVNLDGGGELVAAGHGGPGEAELLPRAGERVLVAVAPTAVSVHTVRPDHASPRNLWPGVVAALELLTDRVRVQVDGAPAVLVDLTPAAVAELGLAPGRQVWLAVKATEVHAYPDAAPSPPAAHPARG